MTSHSGIDCFDLTTLWREAELAGTKKMRADLFFFLLNLHFGVKEMRTQVSWLSPTLLSHVRCLTQNTNPVKKTLQDTQSSV